MRKLSLAAILAVLAGTLGSAIAARAAQDAMTPASSTVNLKGEVLDLNCYMAKDAHGKNHAMCARACLKKGAPAGLLTADGRAYLLSGDTKAYQQVRKMAAETVEVTGKMAERSGLQAVIVEKVRKVKTIEAH
ncbi:MAG TPA: hypothetical protein VNK24_11555 [Elusimicrobiota bacterium]|nr:hypothetical protein [Elusimicrobiota bacterium]